MAYWPVKWKETAASRRTSGRLTQQRAESGVAFVTGIQPASKRRIVGAAPRQADHEQVAEQERRGQDLAAAFEHDGPVRGKMTDRERAVTAGEFSREDEPATRPTRAPLADPPWQSAWQSDKLTIHPRSPASVSW